MGMGFCSFVGWATVYQPNTGRLINVDFILMPGVGLVNRSPTYDINNEQNKIYM